jgi:membrane protease YdiL (CAAX protease family)
MPESTARGSLAMLVASIALYAIHGFFFNFPLLQPNLFQMIRLHPWTFLLKGCVVAPYCEEVLFRGVLEGSLTALIHRVKGSLPFPILTREIRPLASLVQSGVFGLAHLNEPISKSLKLCLFATISMTAHHLSLIARDYDLEQTILYHAIFNFRAFISAQQISFKARSA